MLPSPHGIGQSGQRGALKEHGQVRDLELRLASQECDELAEARRNKANVIDEVTPPHPGADANVATHLAISSSSLLDPSWLKLSQLSSGLASCWSPPSSSGVRCATSLPDMPNVNTDRSTTFTALSM